MGNIIYDDGMMIKKNRANARLIVIAHHSRHPDDTKLSRFRSDRRQSDHERANGKP